MRRLGISIALAVIAVPVFAQPAPVLPAPAALPDAPTCGGAAGSVAQIRAAVAKDSRFGRAGGDAAGEVYSSEELQAIWTFTTAASPAFPAALCEQVVEGGGATRIQRRLHCEAKPAACAAMMAEIGRRDDGSGDGE